MKIAIITDHVPTQYAHSINTMKHAQGFYSLGHEVEILCVQRYIELKNRAKIRDIHDYYDISHKIKIKRFTDKSPLFFRDLRRSLKDYPYTATNKLRKIFPRSEDILDPERKISEYCKKNDFDLAYCRRTENILRYNISNKIPTIFESHDYKKKVSSDLEQVFKLRKSDYFKGIVTIHEILKKNFIKLGIPEDKILVLEDAVDLEKFDKVRYNKLKLRQRLGLPLNKKIVMYCGSLQKGKAIGTILTTASKFHNGTLFYIVGGSAKNKKYWQKIAKKKHIKNIEFLGFKNSGLIPIYLKSADILFMPYDLNEKNTVMDYNTTSPLKLFEYMASKNPIISSKIPTIEKIVRHKEEALLSEPGNINEIVEFIKILLEDEDLAKKLVTNAYDKVKNHSYTKRCKIILEKLSDYPKK